MRKILVASFVYFLSAYKFPQFPSVTTNINEKNPGLVAKNETEYSN